MEDMLPEHPVPPIIQPDAVTVTLGYIQRDIAKIELSIGKIQTESVSRAEFNKALETIRDTFDQSITELKEKIDFQGKIIYGFVALIVITVMAALFKLVIH